VSVDASEMKAMNH